MPPEAWATINTLGPAVVGGLIAWVVARSNKKGARENAIIDQLQEDRTDDRKRIVRLERNDRITQDYVQKLRTHITDGKPPPPPEFPIYPND